ncbi:MAG TPA: hypothetical protein VM265_06285 [Sphingomicrobium sp.]|nr:hypothetical protein [Sphingomicrobium sp.]
MAKDKKKSDGADKKAKKAKRSGEGKKSKRASAAVADEPKVAKVVRSAKRKAADLASNPAVAEVVAATLVAAAAALRNPQKARALAASAREELTEAGKAGAEQGGALWQLALDVARRSLDSLGNEGSAKPKGKTKRKSDG